MHPTIEKIHEVLEAGRAEGIAPLLAENVVFRPPTYWAEWTGREPVAAVLGHVLGVFGDFKYRRVWGDHPNYALEFVTTVDGLDCVGVDLLTLDGEGLISDFEVVMRPLKTIAALREAMGARVAGDKRFEAWAAKRQ